MAQQDVPTDAIEIINVALKDCNVDQITFDLIQEKLGTGIETTYDILPSDETQSSEDAFRCMRCSATKTKYATHADTCIRHGETTDICGDCKHLCSVTGTCCYGKPYEMTGIKLERDAFYEIVNHIMRNFPDCTFFVTLKPFEERGYFSNSAKEIALWSGMFEYLKPIYQSLHDNGNWTVCRCVTAEAIYNFRYNSNTKAFVMYYKRNE